MTGKLTEFLQQEFSRHKAPGWSCTPERAVLPKPISNLLGYAPRVDVLMECATKRIWIEFEVSRADPVANHAKFATAHLFQPLPGSDVFLSMVSRHVDIGRRNLGANAIVLLRSVGVRAYQTLLLPQFNGARIKELNHTPLERLREMDIPVRAELERALDVAEPLVRTERYAIHFAADPLEVALNVRRWNEQIRESRLRALWGRRTVQYFVHDKTSGEFAPAKFAAFLPLVHNLVRVATTEDLRPLMSIDLYCELDESEPRFDGHRARTHLERHLGSVASTPAPEEPLGRSFRAWLDSVEPALGLRKGGPVVLEPVA